MIRTSCDATNEVKRQEAAWLVFDRKQTPDGQIGYKRRDADLWIVFRPEWGWVAYLEDQQSLAGRPWHILPKEQGDHPPAGE